MFKDKLKKIKDSKTYLVSDEDVLWLIEELEEASLLIEKAYRFLGSDSDTDFKVWKTTERYCKERLLG